MSKEIPIIPRELLFGNPDKANPHLSPDGTKIAFLAPLNGVLNVWVGPSAKPDEARAVTQDRVRGIRFFTWAHTNEHVLYLQDKGGDENWRVYSVNLKTNEIKDLTPFEKVQAQIDQISPKNPEEILVMLNDRDPKFHDLYKINIQSCERVLLQKNEHGFAGYLSTDEYQVLFAMAMTADGGMQIVKKMGESWEPFLSIPMEDAMTSTLVGFDKNARNLYLTDSRGRNTGAMFVLDLQTGKQTLLAEDPLSDVDDYLVHPTEKTIQAVAFNYERKSWKVLDPTVQADLDFLHTVADGEIQVISRSLDDSQWIAAFLMDNGPVRYYRYDRRARKSWFLFTNRKALEGQPLVKMHSAVIEARDGKKLVSYYSLPAEFEGKTRPDKPLPTVLWVHGGPWGRDGWGYSPYHQILANRGYVVLDVNFRGSTGFGKDFANAGNLEWGAKMHDDLIDAVDWAIREGISDPHSVAIMGGSYGGYATLAGLTFTPEKFACGVDIVGPSNLITLMNSIPPYWTPMIETFAKRMGDHRTEEGRALLKSRSPLTYADRIRRPLLIGQGANDPRVNQAESDQIVKAMQEKKIPVTYLLYPDEGHGFGRPENTISFLAVAEAFLAQHLEGRFEPIGKAFNGSSVVCPVGAEGVPGLAEALPEKN
jgi:dipeptidyl aminopeptidase/acylaminoacyl peptidase